MNEGGGLVVADYDNIIKGKLEVPTRRKRRYEPLDYTPNREIIKPKPARSNAKKTSTSKPKTTAKPKATKSPEQKDSITKTTKPKTTASNKAKVVSSTSKTKSTTKNDSTKTKSTKSTESKTSTSKTKATNTKSNNSTATKSNTSKTKKDTSVNVDVNINKTENKTKTTTKKTTSKSKAGVAAAGAAVAGAAVAGAVIASKKRQTKKEADVNIVEEKNVNIDINENKATETPITQELHNDSVEVNNIQSEVAMAKDVPPVDNTPKPPPPPPPKPTTPKTAPPKKPAVTPPLRPSPTPPPSPSKPENEAPKKPEKLKKDIDIDHNKLTSDEIKDAKRLEKERIKREKARAKAEAKAQKNLNQDIAKPITADEAKQVDDMNKSKKKGKKKWLWLLLLLLILLLVFFLIWGREIFEVPITYKIDPEGNVIEIASPDEEIPVSEFKFMPGDVISFKEPLYLVHHTRNDDGEYNNMFTFRFKAYVLYEDKVYNIIENFNDGVDAKLVKYRDYWYYQGIILPNNEPVDILNNFTVDIASTTNELSGKTVQLVLELETVYPTEEQIYEKFGGGPGGWLAFVTVMYENYASQGYR